jgi:putative copper export protein
LLVAKVALVVLSAAIGAYHHFGLVPRVVAGETAATRWSPVTLVAESMLLVAVLAVTTWLVTTAPA